VVYNYFHKGEIAKRETLTGKNRAENAGCDSAAQRSLLSMVK